MCSEEPQEMQENKDILSNLVISPEFLAAGACSPLYIVELVAIICTDLKSVFWADSAAETRTVQWKASPVHWKGSHVHWKVAHSAVESWFSQLLYTTELSALYDEPGSPFPGGSLLRTHRLRSYKSP
jgi:hypothetical protein